MNALVVGIVAILLLVLGYIFYGSFIERILGIDKRRETPAYRLRDGRDYVPAKNWLILFGHHFSSIAGAGPILGPVIACVLWGWLPAIIWIVLGGIFLGAVHDFLSLFISIREDGKSVADISKKVVSNRVKFFYASFVWLALVLVIAVFASAAAKTLTEAPEVVIPALGLIPIAILFGFMIYKWKIPMGFATVIGLLLLAIFIILGYKFPVKASFKFWLYLLLIYAFVASITPVNILLQPRDYLSAYILFAGLFIGWIGLFLTHPHINAPYFISFKSVKGSLWPMMFVIIACGAISGFHSLVASGTTSKQLSNEKYAKRIGYGGMLMESVLAVMALLAVSAGLLWKGSNLNLVYPYLMKTKGWIYTFGAGYMRITKPLLGSIGLIAGVTMLNAFILTTLDSATRIARYIGVELFGESFGILIFRNIYFNTLVIILIALFLSLGAWKSIWPVFGASNQLIASLSLFIGSLWLMNKGKKYKIALIPGYFMFITTLGALIYQAFLFFHQRNYLLEIVSLILIILAIFLIFEMIKKQQRRE